MIRIPLLLTIVALFSIAYLHDSRTPSCRTDTECWEYQQEVCSRDGLTVLECVARFDHAVK